MKFTTCITLIIFIIFFSSFVSAGKRAAKKTMEELTDPNSPSYVPIPYPKTKEEIMADFEYYVKKYCRLDSKNVHSASLDSSLYETDVIYNSIFNPESNYKVGDIVKVKNRDDGYADDYSWLIHIMDQNGKNPMVIGMLANGLYAGSATILESDIISAGPKLRERYERLLTKLEDKDIIKILSDSLGRSVDEKEIIKIQRVAFPTSLSTFLEPIWEIKMKGGSKYYFSNVRDMIYTIEKKIPWKKGVNGFRRSKFDLVQNDEFLPDEISDEILILKRIPRKNKKQK